jgi:hypothetical protein
VIMSIVSITLFIFYTYELVVSAPYIKQSLISPLLVKETLNNNNVILYSRGVDKNYFISKIAKINCDCLFMLYTDGRYNFFATYLKSEGRAINIIFKKDEYFSLEDFIKNEIKIVSGNQHD